MSEQVDSVRCSNDGAEFHIAWTARKALRLLDPKSGLKVVTVEGITDLDRDTGKGTDAGILSIDTAEYYGGESLETASKIIYSQLKHSTIHPNSPWELSSGEFSTTLARFAERYLKLKTQYGAKVISKKVRFQFVTNRPVADKISIAISKILSKSSLKDAVISKTIEKLKQKTKFNSQLLYEYFNLVDFTREVGHIQQDDKLKKEIGQFSAILDMDAHAKLKELVRGKGRSEAAKNNGIRRDAVLAAFKCHKTDLFPAPSALEICENTIAREQESSITKAILSAKNPVIIRASGGMGKSVLAQRLENLLPAGSEVVIFDGFAGGDYRSPSHPRHKHSKGLVHLANTLASGGFCDLLLPNSTVESDIYLCAFKRRLIEASSKIRHQNRNAILLIVLDAADNSMRAAMERDEQCFVRDLLRENPPDGCRVVGFTRPEREYILKLDADVLRLDLNGFTLEETSKHLRQKYPSATDADVARFHKLTGMNPRVQANAIADSTTLAQLLRDLGPDVRTIKRIIQDQLDAALNRVKIEHGEEDKITKVCSALAILPPLVPINVLADVADVSVDLVRGFVSDFASGRKLLISDDSVQFHDEPVEDWFHKTFSFTQANCAEIVRRIQQKAETDKYVAMVLPRLLLRAHKYQDLVKLALSGSKFTGGTEIEQREVLLETMRCALQASIKNANMADVAKLMFGMGEESAIEERYSDFLFSNADLVAKLTAPKTLLDLIFQKRVWRRDPIGYVYCAAMLSSFPTYSQEAEEFLKLALQYLENWVNTPKDNRQQVTRKHLALYVYAILHIRGVVAAGKFLSRCRPEAAYEVARDVARRLIDVQSFGLLDSWRDTVDGNIYFRLGLLQELHGIGKSLPRKWLLNTIALLEANPLSELRGYSPGDNNVSQAIVSLAEAAANAGIAKKKILRIFSSHSPEHKRPLSHWDTQKDAVIRVAALKAVLSDKAFTLDDVVPEDLVKVMREKGAEHNSEVQEFKRNYSPLLVWYALRARAIIGRLSEKSCSSEISAAVTAGGTSYTSMRTESQERILVNKIPLLWVDTLLWGKQFNKTTFTVLEKWLKSQVGIFIPTFIELARITGQRGKVDIHKSAFRFACLANELISREHSDARQDADNYSAIARAFLPIDKNEANEYLGQAFKKLHGLGVEVHNRFFALTEMAKQAGQAGKSFPKEAYQLARVIEVFETLNDHKFPWDDATEAIAALCPQTALAIVSRWDDRNRAWIGSTLPQLVSILIRKKEISPTVAIALHVFPGYWDLVEQPELLINAGLRKNDSQKIYEYLLRDIEFSSERSYNLQKIYDVAKRYHFESSRLAERVSFQAKSNKDLSYENNSLFKSSKMRARIKWKELAKGCDFTTAQGIERVVARYWSQHVPLGWEYLFTQIQKDIPSNKRLTYIKSIAEASIEVWQAIEALKVASVRWNESQSARNAIKDTVGTVIKTGAVRFMRESGFSSRDLEACMTLAGITKQEALKSLVSALSNSLASLNAAACFGLAQEISKTLLAPTEAMDALKYGLERLTPILKEGDGDGPFHDGLLPPRNWPETVAAFIFRMLSDPNATIRWRAIHAVRRLAVLEEADIFKALMKLMDATALTAFTDSRYPFYYRHGRLYLLIALARVAKENPAFLKRYSKFLQDLAFSNNEPHVLMRHFAKLALLDILKGSSGKKSSELIKNLQEVNTSGHISRAMSYRTWTQRKKHPWSRRSVHLGIDFEEYWLNPLARAFNLNEHQIARRVHAYIVHNWSEDYSSAWKDDPRARDGLFKSMSTYSSHGEYPQTDRFSFYLEYHAMFCVAGELLGKLPTYFDVDDKRDLWANWLERHLLTRTDGGWVSDRRDFCPLGKPLPPMEQPASGKWRWSVSAADFDAALGINASRPRKLTVWGRRTQSFSGKSEELHVSSAFVTSSTSLALLRALQTIDSFNDFKIPIENDLFSNREPSIKDYKLHGWVYVPDRESGLDKPDPFTGNISYPPPRPGKMLSRICHLTSDQEQRIWHYDSMPVLWTSIWGDKNHEDERNSNNGTWMEADFGATCQLLSRINRDLIISVEVQREEGPKSYTDQEIKYGSNNRLYLLKKDGTIHTLSGYRFFGQNNSRRTKT